MYIISPPYDWGAGPTWGLPCGGGPGVNVAAAADGGTPLPAKAAITFNSIRINKKRSRKKAKKI